MAQVEPHSEEPDDVDEQNPPLSEGQGKEFVRIAFLSPGKHCELHLGPEMGEMESEDAEHDDAENQHILCCPGVCCGDTLAFIAAETSACLDVEGGDVDAVGNVDNETERKDRNHHGDNWQSHELTTFLEKSVCGPEAAGESVDYRKEVDCAVEKQEDDEECSAYCLDQLSAD